jgi:Sulfatase
MKGLKYHIAALAAACTTLALSSLSFAQQPIPPTKPNILVIMADDIGYWNISAYNRGMMGYHTPNIDRIANEGAIFTDYYGQQSCTAGRRRSLQAKAHCALGC